MTNADKLRNMIESLMPSDRQIEAIDLLYDALSDARDAGRTDEQYDSAMRDNFST